MPGSTPAAPNGNFFPNSTYTAANMAANTSQWRPHTSRSGHGAAARSPSPLFAWVRKNQNQKDHDQRDTNDSQSSMDGNSNGSSRHQPVEDGCDHSSLTHTYNFSTSTSSLNAQSQSGAPPPLTREEFEALPVAIQRKYFSTLERLRFAQASDIDDISHHYDQISAHNYKRRKARQDRSASENFLGPQRRTLLDSHFSPADSLAYTGLPDRIKKNHFAREQQSVLARPLPTAVTPDTANEAIYKVGRGTSRQLDVARDIKLAIPSLSSEQNSMDCLDTGCHVLDVDKTAHAPESFYDSFRWLDGDDELDLRLYLDDYHASLNLRENVPMSAKQQRPSFRRHLSISKIQFGRTSTSGSRPSTTDVVTSPTSPAQGSMSPSSEFHFGHTRRKSRALSLITPKNAAQDLITAIDPSAAHYQDPEARHKLRVYLASPQKFDEAIEFGFPSTEAAMVPTEGRGMSKRQSRQKLSDDLNLRTFLADGNDDDDDDVSLNSDQASIADPDSPQTPHALEHPANRPPALRSVSEPIHTHLAKASEGGYGQNPASSREMTLRMTLTRPDLRAQDEHIYGWQQNVMLQTGRRPQQFSHLRDDSATSINYLADAGGKNSSKESVEKVFAGIDHWNASNAPDGNVMKRIWNRVRRS